MGRGPKGLGTVYREAGRGWRAEKWVTLPDGTERRVVARGDTEREALANRDKRERLLQRAHPSADKMTLEQFLNGTWLEQKRKFAKPNTIREYERIIHHTVESIGYLPLARVTPLHVQGLLNEHEPATANSIRRYLRGAFKQAVRLRLLVESPAQFIEAVPTPAPKRKVWQPVEIATFLDSVKRPVARAMYTTAIFAGLRRGELMALPWANVHEDHITVDRTWTRGGVVGTPKTDAAYRDVPISREVYEVIKSARESIGGDLAFPTGNGTMFGGGNLGREWRADLLRVNGKVTVIRFHDLRRTAATLWARQGATPKMIQRFLGHSTIKLALEVYTDVMEDQLQNAAIDPARVLGGLFGGWKITTTGTTGDNRDNARVMDSAAGAGNDDGHQ